MRNNIFNNKKFIIFSFWISISILIAISYLVYHNFQLFSTSRAWVRKTNKSLSELNHTKLLITEAKSEQRGYILTHSNYNLDQYYLIISMIKGSVVNIKMLTRSNPLMQVQADSLRKLIDQRIEFFRKSIIDFKTHGWHDDLIKTYDLQVRELSLNIDLLLEKMKNGERKLLSDREAQVSSNSNRIIIIFLAGLFLCLIIIAWDYLLLNKQIKKRRLVERKSRELNRFLDSVIHNAKVFLCVITGNDKIAIWNDTAANITGYSKSEIEAKENIWKTLFPDEAYRSSIIHEIRASLKNVDTIVNYETVIRTKHGEDRIMLWNIRFMKNESNALEQYIILGNDITVRKKNEKKIEKLNLELNQKIGELKSLNEELESFTYSVSHDLRAPIRHIGGFLDILKNNIESQLDDKNKRYIGLISDSTKEMGMLIDDLLSFSRMGRASLSIVEINLNKAIDETISNLSIETDKRSIEWKINELPILKADPALIKIVFNNLISNAVKYSSKKDRAVIEVGCKLAENNYYTLYVKDNGVGFDMKYYDKLFGVFQRLHSKKDFEGTGIGLATVKKIITKHGGDVWAESALNKGAVFYFTLPQ